MLPCMDLNVYSLVDVHTETVCIHNKTAACIKGARHL